MAVFGDTLRQARAYKGVTLKEAEQATRINRHHLAALEDENFGVLPPLIYQRGIVRNYATYLDLDPGKLLPMFEEARGGDSTSELVAAVKPLDMPTHWAPNFAIIAFLVVMSAIVFAWVYSASFAQNSAPTTASSPPPPTVTPVARLALADPPSPTTVAPAAPPRRGDVAATAPSPTVRVVTPRATRTPEPSPTPRTLATERPTAPTNTTVPPIETPVPPAPEPTVTPAPEPTDVVPVVVEQQPERETPVQQQAQTGAYTMVFTATDYIYLSVSVDGVTQIEQNLGPGESTPALSGSSFQVYTSNAAATSISANGDEPFVMNFDPVELTFNLP